MTRSRDDDEAQFADIDYGRTHSESESESDSDDPTPISDAQHRRRRHHHGRHHRHRRHRRHRSRGECETKEIHIHNRCCNEPPPPPPPPPPPAEEVRQNLTAFVDIRFGSDEPGVARLEDAARPFRTIGAAVEAIFPPSGPPSWRVQVSPGDYPEDVSLPDWVDLAGSGIDSTLIRSVRFGGNNVITDLTVAAPTIPAIFADFSSESGTNGIAWIRGVNVRYPVAMTDLPPPPPLPPTALPSSSALPQQEIVRGLIELTQTRGINAEVFLDAVSVQASFEGLGPGANAIVLNRDARVTLNNFAAEVQSLPEAETLAVRSVGGTTTVQGSQVRVVIGPRFPTRDQAVFDADGGRTIAQNSSGEILLTVLEASHLLGGSGYAGRVDKSARQEVTIAYARASRNGSVSALHSTMLFETVPLGVGVSAQVDDVGSSIELLDVSSPGAFFPALRGVTQNVSYRATSGQGNVVSGGGLYTNVVTVEGGSPGSQRFVQDDDSLILVSGEPLIVLLPDPSDVNTQVVYEGKIVTVKNVSDSIVTVRGKIFDFPSGEIFVIPRESFQLQASDAQWFVVAYAPQFVFDRKIAA